MPEPESIREICRLIVADYRERKRQRDVLIDTIEKVLPPIELPPRPRYFLTGIDRMELEQMGIDAWN